MDIIERVCEGFKKQKRIIIFGASGYGEKAYNILKNKVEVIAFCDNDIKKHGTVFCGVNVIPPSKLFDYVDCAVLIASMYSNEISYQLSQIGISNFFILTTYINSTIETNYGHIPYKINEPLNVNDYAGITVCSETRRKNLSDFSNFLHDSVERPVVTISTEKINYYDDKSKNILFIISHFPPMGGGGIQRNSKYVKYLKRLGYNPIVITWGEYCTEGGYRSRDESNLVDIPSDVTVIRVDHTYSWGDNLTKTEAEEAFAIIDGIIDDDSVISSFLNDMREYNKENHRLGIFFMPWAANALSTLEKLIDYDRIGASYSSAPPYDSHFIGFYVKRKYGIPWVLDYRDPWTDNPSNLKIFEIERAIEKGLSKEADAVITLNKIMAESYYENFGTPNEKLFSIANGYDEEDFINIRMDANKENKKLTIRYGGTLYYDLDPILEFIEVLNELADSGVIDPGKLDVIITGNNGKEVETLIKSLDKYSVFSMHPYVPHSEIVSYMMSANILLLFGRSGKCTYTGKIFEYIRAGVPIFAVGDGGGAANEVIVSTNTGVFFDRSDKDGIKKALTEMYNDFFRKGIYYDPNYDEIKKYTRENLTKKLINVFQYAIENPSQ